MMRELKGIEPVGTDMGGEAVCTGAVRADAAGLPVSVPEASAVARFEAVMGGSAPADAASARRMETPGHGAESPVYGTEKSAREVAACERRETAMPPREENAPPAREETAKSSREVVQTVKDAVIIAPALMPIDLPAASAVQAQKVVCREGETVRMFIAAAEAVAAAILVSPGFVRGEGELLVRLQPEILGGSEVRIVAKDGALTVVVDPATQDVRAIVEANRSRFEQFLAEKVHSRRIAVAVKKGGNRDERV